MELPSKSNLQLESSEVQNQINLVSSKSEKPRDRQDHDENAYRIKRGREEDRGDSDEQRRTREINGNDGRLKYACSDFNLSCLFLFLFLGNNLH